MKSIYTFIFFCLIFTVYSSAQTMHEVSINGFSFTPAELTIAEGDTVMWTNPNSVFHTTTSGDNCMGDGLWDANLSEGATFMYVFEDEGDYPYFCRPHCQGGMTGEITVEGTSALKDIKKASDYISISPNPVNEHTTLRLKNEEMTGTYNLKIYDLNGQLKDERKTFLTANNGLRLNLTSFQSGVYYYELQNVDGKSAQKYVGKIMIN